MAAPKKPSEAYERDYTLAEWLTKRRISRSRFKVLKAKDLAPEFIQRTPRGKITITREADAAWARMMEEVAKQLRNELKNAG